MHPFMSPGGKFFLEVSWQSYDGRIPTLNEVDFKEHNESVWTFQAPVFGRKASPSVNIILHLYYTKPTSQPGVDGAKFCSTRFHDL